MKISVVIPTWNREKKIKSAILSVLEQSVPVHEILICDDGSDDDTKLVIDSFNENRIKYLQLTHSGLPAVARNVGILEATGDWIAFLDSDDEWLSNKLETQISYVRKTGCELISSNAFKIKNNKISKLLNGVDSKKISLIDLLNENTIINSTVLVNKNTLLKADLFSDIQELKAVEDYHLWLKISLLHFSMYYLDIPLIKYYDQPASSIRNLVSKNPFLLKAYVLSNIIHFSKNIKISFFNYLLIKYMYFKNMYQNKFINHENITYS